MSAVTTQPIPFGLLEREKHIENVLGSLKEKKNKGTEEPVDNTVLSGATWSHLDSIRINSKKLKDLEEKAADGDFEKVKEDSSFGIPSNNSQKEEWIETGFHTPSLHMDARGQGTMQELPGLQPLHKLNQLCITAKAGQQGLTCDPGRTYIITSQKGEQLYTAIEDTSCLCLNLCGAARSCCIKIYNLQSEEVLHFARPFRIDACCFGCCLMEIYVFNAQKEQIGTIRQRWSMFTPLLEICDMNGHGIMKIHGSCCPCRCYSDQELKITSKIGNHLGLIWKRWQGYNSEHNMDHEYFVPNNMDPNEKVLLLAAAFLLVSCKSDQNLLQC
ncbi:phospholipid scramblase family member 5 isoform X2 [Scyliorhinus torazame]|uniref:phospholipid scramblase family member 5 isoform X2 n=1 Tax=Scyliorhinus torazame TaxID=75743 RepID=UPI003B5C619A